MGFESFLFDRLLFVRWSSNPTIADVVAFERLTLDAARRAGGRIVIIVETYSLEPPPSDVRARFQSMARNTGDQWEQLIVVIEGEGVGPMIVRTVSRGVLIMAGQTARAVIASDVAEAVRTAAKTLGIRASELDAKLRARGAIGASAKTA